MTSRGSRRVSVILVIASGFLAMLVGVVAPKEKASNDIDLAMFAAGSQSVLSPSVSNERKRF